MLHHFILPTFYLFGFRFFARMQLIAFSFPIRSNQWIVSIFARIYAVQLLIDILQRKLAIITCCSYIDVLLNTVWIWYHWAVHLSIIHYFFRGTHYIQCWKQNKNHDRNGKRNGNSTSNKSPFAHTKYIKVKHNNYWTNTITNDKITERKRMRE